LPEAFVSLIDRPGPFVWWVAKGDPKQWIFRGGEGGVYWVPEGTPDCHESLDSLLLSESEGRIETETNQLAINFHVAEYTPEEIAEGNAEYDHLPGFIPFITDFSRIVQFGRDGCEDAYCFDYRDYRDEPSPI